MKESLSCYGQRCGVKIELFDSVDSTNDVIRRGDYSHGDAVVALSQSSGRGQRGNSWESTPGQNLTFSIYFTPEFLPAERQFLLSEAVALAVVDMLSGYSIHAQVKWTNDIYVDGRKIAGILIENDICGTNLARSVVGIGLNVNQVHFSDALPNPTSMAIVGARHYNSAEVFENLHRSLMEYFTTLEQGYADEIESHYHRSLYRRDERHAYFTPDGEEFYTTIVGVEPTGELVTRNDDGTMHRYLFKEIEFKVR